MHDTFFKKCTTLLNQNDIFSLFSVKPNLKVHLFLLSSFFFSQPQVLWAQDKKRIFITINVECKAPEIKYTDDSLYFKGVGLPENKLYETTMEFSNKIVPDKSISKNITRCIEFTLQKADENGEYWSTLLKNKQKPAWLKVDFNKWKDEDDDDDNEDGMDMGDMGGMGGMDFGGGNMDEMLKSLAKAKGGSDVGPDGKPSFNDSESEDSDDDIPAVE